MFLFCSSIEERIMSAFKERSIAAQERLSRPERLGPLAARGGVIFCWCNRCAHHARLDGRQLTLTLGPDFPIPEVGAKLRCSNCGAKDVATSAEITGEAVSAAPLRAAPPAAARPRLAGTA
jgi:hypothetical protein